MKIKSNVLLEIRIKININLQKAHYFSSGLFLKGDVGVSISQNIFNTLPLQTKTLIKI